MTSLTHTCQEEQLASVCESSVASTGIDVNDEALRDRPVSSKIVAIGSDAAATHGTVTGNRCPRAASFAPSLSDGLNMPKKAPSGHTVTLHVYDVGENQAVAVLNAIFANRWSPLKFGGVFHVGVEVHGKEWTFGAAPLGTGVCCSQPKSHPQHTWRQSVSMDTTWLSEANVEGMITWLSEEFLGTGYHLCNRNCCHFARALCNRMGVGEVPNWLFRWSSVASFAVSGYSALGDRFGGLQLRNSMFAAIPDQQVRQGRIVDEHGRPIDKFATFS